VNAAGSAIAVTMEGTRPILVEIQGLTSPTQFGNARRTPNGVDFNRLVADHSCAHPPCWVETCRAGCLCQRGGRHSN
jgi:hypothetical protein